MLFIIIESVELSYHNFYLKLVLTPITSIDNASYERNIGILSLLEMNGVLPIINGDNSAARGNFEVLQWLIQRNIYPDIWGVFFLLSKS